MERTSSFGYWIRRRRKALDLTQDMLARQAGYATATIKKIEADERRPSREQAERLAEVLKIAPEDRTTFLQMARAGRRTDCSDTVTFLVTDIEGSTQLWEQQPEAMRCALARHDTILRQIIATCGGVVFKSGGDGVYAAFARAADALDAAIVAQRALVVEPWGTASPLHVRIVLHTGVAEARDGDYFGPPLNRAARLLAAGHGGQILLSRATWELLCDTLPPELALHDLGTHRLKNLMRPEHIFQVVAPNLPAEFPPLRVLQTRSHNLPAQVSTLIGRRREVAAACTLLRRADLRLLTLTGPGGIGKTRLALQVASELLEDFADGVYWVSLAPIGDPELVATTIAKTLGLRESDQRSALQRLKDYLRDKKLLLLLDNFEQIVGAASLIAELLAAAPALKALVTSRTTLRLCGEHEVVVPPLGLPACEQPAGLDRLIEYEAIQLFVERAQAIKTNFAITFENAAAIVEVCRRLDGLPLAIELAAARVKLFSPQALLARLSSPLALLTAGARDLPARQQTLRATIDWSYNLLDKGEKTLFARLGIFVGGCTFEAAQAVCGDCRLQIADCRLEQSDQSTIYNLQFVILEGLASLVDQSLVREEIQANGEPRFTMLETIREYALERLEQSGEAEALRWRHAAYYLALAETAEPQIRGPNQEIWLARLEQEHDNLWVVLGWAIQHAQADTAMRLSGTLWFFWMLRGYVLEARRWSETVLTIDGTAPPAVRAQALLGAGLLARPMGGAPRAQIYCEQSLALWQELGDKRGIADALSGLATVAHLHGDYVRARMLEEQSLALHREIDNKWSIAMALHNLGYIAFIQGDYEQARSSYEESLTLFRALGDKRRYNSTIMNLGMMTLVQGDYTQAEIYYAESLALAQEIKDKPIIATLLNNQGYVAYVQGDYEQAQVCYEESWTLWRELGERDNIPISSKNLGLVALAQDDHMRAQAYFTDSLTQFHEQGNKRRIAECLEGLAGVAAAQAQPERAARLWGAAETLREATGTPIHQVDRPIYDRRVSAARAQLDEPAFAAAWASGRALPLEQAIADALMDGK